MYNRIAETAAKRSFVPTLFCRFQKKMTSPSSLHFSPVVNLVRAVETQWRCNYCEYAFKSKLYVSAKSRAYLSADALDTKFKDDFAAFMKTTTSSFGITISGVKSTLLQSSVCSASTRVCTLWTRIPMMSKMNCQKKNGSTV